MFLSYYIWNLKSSKMHCLHIGDLNDACNANQAKNSFHVVQRFRTSLHLYFFIISSSTSIFMFHIYFPSVQSRSFIHLALWYQKIDKNRSYYVYYIIVNFMYKVRITKRKYYHISIMHFQNEWAFLKLETYIRIYVYYKIKIY